MNPYDGRDDLEKKSIPITDDMHETALTQQIRVLLTGEDVPEYVVLSALNPDEVKAEERFRSERRTPVSPLDKETILAHGVPQFWTESAQPIVSRENDPLPVSADWGEGFDPKVFPPNPELCLYRVVNTSGRWCGTVQLPESRARSHDPSGNGSLEFVLISTAICQLYSSLEKVLVFGPYELTDGARPPATDPHCFYEDRSHLSRMFTSLWSSKRRNSVLVYNVLMVE